MGGVVIARTSAMVSVDGTRHRVRRNRTTAHADHPVVRDHPDLWSPLPIDFRTPAKPKATKKAAQG